jgi:RNA polymerase sigma-70 factor, ECF subfamily
MAITPCRPPPLTARWRAVSVTANKDIGPGECATLTLGHLLYADKEKTRTLEKEWRELVRSIAGRDQVALHSLYARTHRVVFTLIMRIVNNRETAEEVTLDVFHDVWRRASTYDAEGGTVLGWIMNQARSRAIDRLRYEQRQKRNDPHPDSSAEEATEIRCDEALDLCQDGARLRTALDVLTPDERRAIETAFFSEFTYAEVAERLNTPLGTIKTRIRAGLMKLRRALTAVEVP